MYPAIIETYDAPTSVKEALQILAKHGIESCFVAGGQSLMQAMKARVTSPKSLIDLQHVTELRGIEYKKGEVRIGAMTRYRDIAADERLDGTYQALRDAASHVGDRQVRNRGTIGGSLCWNYIAACMPPTCIGVGASLELVSKAGKRTLLAEKFLHGPLETARHDDELVVAVTLPAAPKHVWQCVQEMGLGHRRAARRWGLCVCRTRRRPTLPSSSAGCGRTGNGTAASRVCRKKNDRRVL